MAKFILRDPEAIKDIPTQSRFREVKNIIEYQRKSAGAIDDATADLADVQAKLNAILAVLRGD